MQKDLDFWLIGGCRNVSGFSVEGRRSLNAELMRIQKNVVGCRCLSDNDRNSILFVIVFILIALF